VDKENQLTIKLLAMKHMSTQSSDQVLRALEFFKSGMACGVRILGPTIARSLFVLGLVGLTFFFTYMTISHNYSLKMEEVKDKLSMNLHETAAEAERLAAKAEHLENELKEHQDMIFSLSRKGKRKSLGTFTVTAYDPIESCKPFDDGITSQLIPAGMGVAAVDPRVIPYGAVLYLPEIDRYFFASDTGAAMKRGNGRNIDILMPTVQDALEFGRRRLQVELIDLSRG
jgi:3D (Asp-Asp-Asp) domain-containing protein